MPKSITDTTDLGMKNILMLITELGLGGAEKVFYDHVQAFSKHYNIVVCLFDKNEIYNGFQFSNEVVGLDDKRLSNPFSRWMHRKKRLEHLIQTHKIDVCISHMEGPNFLNAATNSSCKKLLIAHGSVSINPQKSNADKFITNKFLIPFLYNRSHQLITVSNALRDEHIAVGTRPEKVTTINNFFEVDKIQQLAVEPTELDEVFINNNVLIHVGRLANQKNQRFLIKLMKSLRDNGRKEKLVIVGEGDLKDQLIEQAASLNLKVYDHEKGLPVDENADVFFTGAVANPYKYISKAKLFLLSSFNEGFPLVLGESLACGTPIVSIDCPTGPRELLCKEGEFTKSVSRYETLDCGNLVGYFTNDESGDLDAYYNAVIDLIDNEEKYNSMKQVCAIKSRDYDKSVILKKWIEVIES